MGNPSATPRGTEMFRDRRKSEGFLSSFAFPSDRLSEATPHPTPLNYFIRSLERSSGGIQTPFFEQCGLSPPPPFSPVPPLSRRHVRQGAFGALPRCGHRSAFALLVECSKNQRGSPPHSRRPTMLSGDPFVPPSGTTRFLWFLPKAIGRNPKAFFLLKQYERNRFDNSASGRQFRICRISSRRSARWHSQGPSKDQESRPWQSRS
jgi:hypothetical protein